MLLRGFSSLERERELNSPDQRMSSTKLKGFAIRKLTESFEVCAQFLRLSRNAEEAFSQRKRISALPNLEKRNNESRCRGLRDNFAACKLTRTMAG